MKDKNIRERSGIYRRNSLGVDPNEILSRLDGTVFNNNLTIVYNPTFRPFTFQYNLSPRDRGEQLKCKK